jgi:hypothetical protein
MGGGHCSKLSSHPFFFLSGLEQKQPMSQFSASNNTLGRHDPADE